MKKQYIIGKDFALKKVNQIEKKKSSLSKKPTEGLFFVKNGLEKYLNIGYYLIIPITIFLVVGLWLDNIFQSRPIFILIFLFFGTLSSFFNLYRLIKSS